MINPPFICGFWHHVEVTWSHVVPESAPIIHAVTGRQAGDRHDAVYRAIWPNDRFSRDDIDSDEVQRGFQSMRVFPISRRFWRTDQVQILLHKGVVRCATQSDSDPFFAGFAPDLVTAATWVATGRGPLIVPWETSPCATPI